MATLEELRSKLIENGTPVPKKTKTVTAKRTRGQREVVWDEKSQSYVKATKKKIAKAKRKVRVSRAASKEALTHIGKSVKTLRG